MKTTVGIVGTLILLVASAAAEIKSIDIKIFGMD